MSFSSDPLGQPVAWARINPVTGQTQPGFMGGDDTLAHRNLDPSKAQIRASYVTAETESGTWSVWKWPRLLE